MQKTPNWSFIDVLEGCRDEETLRDVLWMTRDGRSIVKDTLGVPKQAKGVMMTLKANIKNLKPVAAAMDHSDNISLTDWAPKPGGVLVLQNVFKYRANLYPLFKWVFKRVFELLVSDPPEHGRTTFIIDEARQAPFLADLIDLATEGREYNIGFVAGWQDEQGMRRVIGEDGVGELRSCYSTQVYLQNNNPASAKRASERFAQQLLIIGEMSQSTSKNTSNNTPGMDEQLRHKAIESWITRREEEEAAKQGLKPVNYPGIPYTQIPRAPVYVLGGDFQYPSRTSERELWEKYHVVPQGCPVTEEDTTGEGLNLSLRQVERDMVSPADILHQRKAEMVDGELETYALIASAHLGCWSERTSGMQRATMPRDVSVVAFEKRPDRQLRFDGWTSDDRERLHLPELEEPSEEAEDQDNDK